MDIERDLSEEEANRRAKLLKAIAEPTRMRLLLLLAKQGGTMCVRDMVPYFAPLVQSGVSMHLRILADAGLVRSHKSRSKTIYVINPTKVREAYEAVGMLMPESA
jgi:DNA-binding transcriptional ArsR family regulator